MSDKEKITREEASAQIAAIKERVENIACPFCGKKLGFDENMEANATCSARDFWYELYCDECGWGIDRFVVYPVTRKDAKDNQTYTDRILSTMEETAKKLEECKGAG